MSWFPIKVQLQRREGELEVRKAAAWMEGNSDQGWPLSPAHTHPYLEWGHLMCSHSFR